MFSAKYNENSYKYFYISMSFFTEVFQHFKGADNQEGDQFFTWSSSDRTGGTVLNQKRVDLD